MFLPHVLSELVIATVSLELALILGTTGDLAKVLDVVHAMDSLAVTSKVCLAAERMITVSEGADKSLGADSVLL
jgi:hypothetical protein